MSGVGTQCVVCGVEVPAADRVEYRDASFHSDCAVFSLDPAASSNRPRGGPFWTTVVGTSLLPVTVAASTARAVLTALSRRSQTLPTKI